MIRQLGQRPGKQRLKKEGFLMPAHAASSCRGATFCSCSQDGISAQVVA
jgi:hypothetical protein